MTTHRQIAAIVGVSQATVTRILNFDATMQALPQTRQTIIETAEALNHATPRALQGKAAQEGRLVPGKVHKIAMVHFLRPERELADACCVGMRPGVESRCAALGPELSKACHADQRSEGRSLAGLSGAIAVANHPDARIAWPNDHMRNLDFADFLPLTMRSTS